MSTYTWNDMRSLAVKTARGEVLAHELLEAISAFSDGETAKAVQAERERIAEAIEAIPTQYKYGGNDRYPSDLRAEAARIARAES